MSKKTLTRSEMIEFIITSARDASKIKDKKKRERMLSNAKIHLIKSTDKEVEDLYSRVKREGAEAVFK